MESSRLIQRQSSIENEPLTLNLNQIQFAREAALYVVKTRSMEEALRVFTEGLEPVVRACGDEGSGYSCSEEENDYDRIQINRTEGPGDVVSAPF